MSKIIIGADFVPTESNEDLFTSGAVFKLVGEELVGLLNEAEFRIFNLEMPLTEKKNPREKCGPTLRGNPNAIKTYKELHVDLLTLANNHIMDQSEDGFNDTISVLKLNGINYIGAGKDLGDACRPCVYKCKNGKTVGIYACTEHEFSIASENEPGANPYDPLESFDHISRLAEKCDYVIVLYHGGKEFYRYPSPHLQKVCHKFVEKGAGLVITQHCHCIGCQEEYNGGVIVYGQGNFLFDGGENEFWKTGLLTCVDTDSFSCTHVPIVKVNETVRLANESQSIEILDDFIHRSTEIINPSFVEKRYREFAEKNIETYLISLYGIGSRNLFFRIMNKLSGYKYQTVVVKRRYGMPQCLAIQNYVDCEAHEELLLEGLKQYRKRL